MKLTLTIFLFFCVFVVEGQIITTYAGNGIGGTLGDDGIATSAELSYPTGLDINAEGSLIICHGLKVRKIDPITGIIISIAGSDTASGFNNGGPATCALVNMPVAVCEDGLRNFYVSDYWENTVRKVDYATKIISKFAGTGSVGNTGDGGAASAATFNSLGAVCIDTVRKLMYVCAAYNYRVRKIDLITGIISAYAGTGSNGFAGDGSAASSAKFSRTAGIAIDHLGNVYIGDWDNHRIRRVDIATGIITTYAGNGSSGYTGDGITATSTALSKPMALCFDSCDNLFFCDEDSNRVRRIDANTHIITTVAGNGVAGFFGDGGAATAAQFNHPTGIAIDKYGNLFVSDYYNHRVRKITADTAGCYKKPVVDPTLGIVTNSLHREIVIYPNPAQSELTITAGTKITGITIGNIIGRQVYSHEYNTENVTMNIAHLPAGCIYPEDNR